MKKGLVVALALLTITFTALPLFALDVQFSGDYRIRGFYFDSLFATKPVPPPSTLGDAAQTSNFLDQRFRLTSRITAGMTTGVVQLDFLHNPSNVQFNLGNRTLNDGTFPGFGGESISVGVRQAYLVVNFPVARLYAGRPEVTLGHGLTLKNTLDVIGIASQIPVPGMPIDFQLGYGKLAEFDSFTSGHTKDLDLDFYAATLAIKPTPDHSFGGFIFYGQQRIEGCLTAIALTVGCTLADGSTIFVPPALPHDLRELMFGVTADGKLSVPGMGALRYAAEFDNFSGTNFDSRGIMGYNAYADVGADVDLPGAGSVSLGLAYLRIQGPSPSNLTGKVGVNSLKGDFKFANILFANSQNNYDGVDFNSSFADANVTTSAQNATLSHNIHGVKVYAGLKPTDKLNVEIAVLPYVWAVRGGPLPAPSAPDAGRNVGFEIDLNAGYKIDDNLKLTAGYGFFNPGDAFKSVSAGQREKNVNKVEVAMTFTF